MKRFLSRLLVIFFCISLAACNADQNTPAANSGTNETSGLSTAEISGEITVSCYNTMRYKSFLEEAARLFEDKYPETRVNVETFSAMPEINTANQDNRNMTAIQMQDDPQGRADYISRINTSLMSGEGADILAMDVLPVHKYADGGQLENLSGYMEADSDFNRSDYRKNILDAVEYKGGTWFLPMDYTFNYYAYDSTLLQGDQTASFGTGSAFTIEQLIELAGASFDGETKLFNSPDYVRGPNAGMFGQMLNESYTSFVDLESKSANFNAGGFAKLLETVKEYSGLGYIPQGVTGQKEASAIMQQQPTQQTDRYFFKLEDNFSLMQQFNKNSGRKMMIRTAGDGGGIKDDDEIAGIQADKDGNVPFEFEQAYGLNKNSKNKRTAWAFLKFLLSEEMQTSTKLSPVALPINNAARQQKAELLISGAFMGEGRELDDTLKEVLRQYTEAVEQLSDQINCYKIKDTIVNDMIAAEVQYFFDGSKTSDDVANVLQNKVELYLGE